MIEHFRSPRLVATCRSVPLAFTLFPETDHGF